MSVLPKNKLNLDNSYDSKNSVVTFFALQYIICPHSCALVMHDKIYVLHSLSVFFGNVTTPSFENHHAKQASEITIIFGSLTFVLPGIHLAKNIKLRLH